MWDLLIVAALVGGSVPAGLRWLRVAQREHYLAPGVSRFAWRWWTVTPLNMVWAASAVLAAVLMAIWVQAGLVTAAMVAAGPLGLTVKGKTSPLAWTWRLRRVAIVLGVVLVVSAVLGLLVHPIITGFAVLAMPLLIDASLLVLAPLERKLGTEWVSAAAGVLAESGATVVAITGSYGKTSTKGYVAHLLADNRRVLASPASFNNRMGLARAINENMSSGIDVFVAEMGTYGPGEIADLCSWIPPEIAVITAIGPVHLERFGSEDRIVEAKSEILADARVAVLNVDDARLAAVADGESSHRRIIRVGTSPGLDVSVLDGRVVVGGEDIGSPPPSAHATNVAAAMGVVLALGVEASSVAARLGSLTEPDHRLTVATGRSGVTIVDDTFNSNPAGAQAALRALASVDANGRRVVVTPGMVELGKRQAEENRLFASRAASVADRMIIVGRTNARALIEGALQAGLDYEVLEDRIAAVEWVRANLGAGDAVLYENDLPDHFP